VLFPAFAKLDPEHEQELVKTIFASSIKYTSILLVPATMVLMALSGPLIGTLYGEKYVYGPFLLSIAVIGTLFALLGYLSVNSFLSAMGETTMLMKQTAVTLVVGVPLGFLLIPTLGITGLIIANLLAMLPGMFWVLYWIWKHYKARADFQSSARILGASAIAALLAYLPATYLQMANWIRLILGLAVFLSAYFVAAPLVGAVCSADINNLRIMFSGMGFVSKILNPFLGAAQRVTEFKASRRART
jgi:O-antigen/teichoic acid export membrane protein